MSSSGVSRAIIAPIPFVGDLPSTSRTAVLRVQRLARSVEQFFDPTDIQSFTFFPEWKEIPGISRLLVRSGKAFEAINTAWPDWEVAHEGFGIYHPFFAASLSGSGTVPKFELPVWPVANEQMGRYVHRFLTAAAAKIEGLEFSDRDAAPPKLDRAALPILKETFDLARQTLEGTADSEQLQGLFVRWTRMGVIRNSYHKPVAVLLKGKDPEGVVVERAHRAAVSRLWGTAAFDVHLKAGQEARLFFSPPMRSIYMRSARVIGEERSWAISIGAGGAATIEELEDDVRLFVAYGENGYARFSTPSDSTIRQFSFEYQIRDDPHSQLAILENAVRGLK